MVWKDCGYLSLTKDGKKVSVVVKHVRYVAKRARNYNFIKRPTYILVGEEDGYA
ncbi:MAG: hypothetical protein ABSC20_04905 [Candidatus Bathyarchaeia archaeon]|jgi:hypothetical protein